MAALGNDATPQRHEHWQAPVPSIVPVPEAKVPLLADEVAAAPATELDVAPVPEPPAMTGVVPVPF
jgi:hypothetical protein